MGGVGKTVGRQWGGFRGVRGVRWVAHYLLEQARVGVVLKMSDPDIKARNVKNVDGDDDMLHQNTSIYSSSAVSGLRLLFFFKPMKYLKRFSDIWCFKNVYLYGCVSV